MTFAPYSFTDETDPLGPPANPASNTPLDNATFQAMQNAIGTGILGSYRRLMFGSTVLTTGAGSGTTYMFVDNATNPSALNIATGSTSIGYPLLSLVAADYAVTGLTTKLNVRATVATSNTAPARTITIGLYPLTIAASVVTPGTVVSGSTVAHVSPAANSFVTLASGDFTLPSDGPFSFGVTLSGAPSGQIQVFASLLLRHV